MTATTALETLTEALASPTKPHPKPWPGPVSGSHRMGYEGPGVPLYSLRGARQAIRERWRRRVHANTTLTFSAWAVAIVLADHGNRDGTCIYPSQERLADELNLATGTISRGVCELEDAGYLRVKRSKPRQDCETGHFTRGDTNRYTLCVPPQGAAERGVKGRRKKRRGCPAAARRAAQERRRAETLARLTEAVGVEEAQRLAGSAALGAFRPGRNDACTCGSGAKTKACCGAERGPGGAGQPAASVPPTGAGELTSLPAAAPLHEVDLERLGHQAEEKADESPADTDQAVALEEGANPWSVLKDAHRGLLERRSRHAP